MLQIKRIPTTDIRVPDELREMKKEKVDVIANSMAKIGLRTPITVRETSNGYFLVTGRHRLEAAKQLGWKKISCFPVNDSKLSAKLWSIAENLHRAELAPLEHARLIKLWKRLLKRRSKAVQNAEPGGHQPNDKGISKVAKQLGLSREKVRRLATIERISSEAKVAAKKAGLDKNQRALVEIGKAKSPKAQLKKVDELSRKTKKPPKLSKLDRRCFLSLKRRFVAAQTFKRTWRKAPAIVQRKFVQFVLRPGSE